jgi:hypothetical protein
MKHLLTGVAVVAALAFAAPVWAQPANPSAGNPVGTPSAAPAAMAPGPAETSSAMPPSHRHARHTAHRMATYRPGKAPELTGSTANQLNQEELGRLQPGNMAVPPAPEMSSPAAPAAVGRGPGPKTSGTGYISPTPGAGMSPPPHSPHLVGTTPGGNP